MQPIKTRQIRKAFRVEPITNPEVIRFIRNTLKSKPRDLLLFDLVTQTGIEIKQILPLKVKDLLDLKIGDRFVIAALAGKSPDAIVMTQILYQTWQKYLSALNPDKDAYVIKSRKGKGPLHLSTVSDMMRRWLESADQYNLGGARTLRKTWEVNQFVNMINNVELGAKKAFDWSPEPVKHTAVHRSVYQQLFRAIVSGRIPPGERLVTHQLAKQLNVSQAPVREALRLMEAVGLVSSPQKKGSIVNELSKDNLKEISELRIMLELKAAEKAALKCRKNTLRQLKILHEKYTQAIKNNEVEQSLEFNKQFHYTIYAAANMPILMQVVKGLWDRMSPYLHLLFKVVKSYDQKRSIENHQNVLEGLKNGSQKEVHHALKKDLIYARKQILDFFDKIEESTFN